jgi:putative restriction endonuclease
LFFGAVRGPTDHPNAYFPFFHLAGKLRGGLESFWHLQPLPGRSVALGALSTARSVADITNNVAYAKLDEGLFCLLQNLEAIDALSEVLARRWFDRGLQDLHAVVGRSSEISRYERSIRSGTSLQARETQPPSYVRSPAFRRVVVQVYDYRCAATGLRLLLDSGEAMVEAAHIHPFSEAGDDDPRNGLALTPNMHWAMDKNLIAPGPDYVWHVSRPLMRGSQTISHSSHSKASRCFSRRIAGCGPSRRCSPGDSIDFAIDTGLPTTSCGAARRWSELM